MAIEERDHGPATRVAIRHLASLKPDHQELLKTLLGDAGMGRGTLESLVEHLLEEEGPQLQHELVRLRAAGPSSAVETTAPSVTQARGLSVGSLRPAASGDPAARGSVGSLRDR